MYPTDEIEIITTNYALFVNEYGIQFKEACN